MPAHYDDSHNHKKAEQVGGDEPPPRLSVRGGVGIRKRLVRSTVTVGGGRSPLAFGKKNQ